MTHQRNVNGLRASAQKRHEEAVVRAEDAILQMCAQGSPINFPSVAQAAGVSVAWLYQNPTIKQRIQSLRQQQHDERPIPPNPPRPNEPESSKDVIIAALKQKIKDLSAENCELKKQLEVAYGQLRQQHKLSKSSPPGEKKP
jgi:hypothetical protein